MLCVISFGLGFSFKDALLWANGSKAISTSEYTYLQEHALKEGTVAIESHTLAELNARIKSCQEKEEGACEVVPYNKIAITTQESEQCKKCAFQVGIAQTELTKLKSKLQSIPSDSLRMCISQPNTYTICR